MNLKEKVREIPDFPKEGINFKDITTLLKDSKTFHYIIDKLSDQLKGLNIDIIVGPESRGFLFGTAVAYNVGAGFVPVRKPGKLPAEVLRYQYQLEYGTDALEIHTDAILPGQKVVIIDDLLATGGTVLAVAKLIEQLGGEVVSVNVLMELLFLRGRDTLKNYNVKSLIQYE